MLKAFWDWLRRNWLGAALVVAAAVAFVVTGLLGGSGTAFRAAGAGEAVGALLAKLAVAVTEIGAPGAPEPGPCRSSADRA